MMHNDDNDDIETVPPYRVGEVWMPFRWVASLIFIVTSSWEDAFNASSSWSVDHFTKGVTAVIPIRWEMSVAIISFTVVSSLQYFVHGKEA